jgi:hypothetical protein
VINPFVWENPLQRAGIGRGLSSVEVMRQATAKYSRLVREMAVKESPMAEVSALCRGFSHTKGFITGILSLT